MIGRNGERGSGISALAARHDDDEQGYQRSVNKPKCHLLCPMLSANKTVTDYK